MDKKDYLLREFEKTEISLTGKQADQLLSYYDLLMEQNKVMNLTAVTGFEDVVKKHFVDSAAPAVFLHMENVRTLIDVGSGAGFPGIPLKIVYPHLQVVLLDSLNKRVRFLDQVIDVLKLDQIKAVHMRAEDAAHDPAFREQFDLCVSRAVANLSTLAEYALPFVRPGGFFAAYKSGRIDDECAQAAEDIHLLGGGEAQVEKFFLPDTEIARSIVMIPKENRTSPKYPRKAGIPEKEPIH